MGTNEELVKGDGSRRKSPDLESGAARGAANPLQPARFRARRSQCPCGGGVHVVVEGLEVQFGQQGEEAGPAVKWWQCSISTRKGPALSLSRSRRRLRATTHPDLDYPGTTRRAVPDTGCRAEPRRLNALSPKSHPLLFMLWVETAMDVLLMPGAGPRFSCKQVFYDPIYFARDYVSTRIRRIPCPRPGPRSRSLHGVGQEMAVSATPDDR